MQTRATLAITNPPAPSGPPGCEAPVRNPAIWFPAFLSILLALKLYILYILCLLSILLLSVCSVVLTPTDSPFYPPLPRVARFWAPPLTSRNPFKFKGFTNTAHIHKKRLQGIKNDSKKCPKACRKSSKSVKRLKYEI